MTPILEKNWRVESLDLSRESRLNKRSIRPLVCGALVLGEVHLDKKETKLCLLANDQLARTVVKQFKLPVHVIYPLTHNEVEFYLYYSACIHQIKMSEKYEEISYIGAPLEGHIWEISSEDLKKMAHKNWNHCLVEADKIPFIEKNK